MGVRLAGMPTPRAKTTTSVIIVRNDSPHLDRPLRLLGQDMATLTPAMPSMFIYAEEAWREGLETGFPFHQNVEHEGVDVF